LTVAQPFFVKLPVFELEGGKRGLMVSARVTNSFGRAEATLFCDDGTVQQMQTSAHILARAAQQGPFIFLREVDMIGDAAERPGAAIVGPDGMPVDPTKL
jgi:hypothetical protein